MTIRLRRRMQPQDAGRDTVTMISTCGEQVVGRLHPEGGWVADVHSPVAVQLCLERGWLRVREPEPVAAPEPPTPPAPEPPVEAPSEPVSSSEAEAEAEAPPSAQELLEARLEALLAGNVGDVERRVLGGEADDVLDLLLDRASRKGVKRAIRARKAELGG